MRVKDFNAEQMILETAERLFLEKGYAMTSTTEIAKVVGCNQALIHYYFRTKEKLFQKIFEQKASLFISAFVKLSENANLPFEEKLKGIIEAHFDVIKANPKIPFLFFNELNTNLKSLEYLVKENKALPAILSGLDKKLQVEIKKKTIRNISTLDLLLSIISLNMILFLSIPILKMKLNISEKEIEEMIENRKKENVLIILKSLKP